MTFISRIPFLVLAPAALSGQNAFGRLRVEHQPKYVAPDSSVSEIRKGAAKTQVGEVTLVPSSGSLTLRFVINDAEECAGPESVEHHIQADTLDVTLFYDLPTTCPGVVTPREYVLTVSHLRHHSYLLRVYHEGRGGRGGQAAGDAPWLIVPALGL